MTDTTWTNSASKIKVLSCITLALAEGKYLDLKKTYQSIKEGGYEPEVVFLRISGEVKKEDNQFFLQDEKNQLSVEGIEENGKDLVGAGNIEVDVHLEAERIPSMTPHDPFMILFDTRVEEQK